MPRTPQPRATTRSAATGNNTTARPTRHGTVCGGASGGARPTRVLVVGAIESRCCEHGRTTVCGRRVARQLLLHAADTAAATQAHDARAGTVGSPHHARGAPRSWPATAGAPSNSQPGSHTAPVHARCNVCRTQARARRARTTTTHGGATRTQPPDPTTHNNCRGHYSTKAPPCHNTATPPR